MKTEHLFYDFTAERDSEVDARLERTQSELAGILAEYRRIVADTNRNGYTATTMESTFAPLCNVRLELQEEQNGLGKRL